MTFFCDQVLFCYVCLMHSMCDISWLNIVVKLDKKLSINNNHHIKMSNSWILKGINKRDLRKLIFG